MTITSTDKKEASLKVRIPETWKRCLEILAHGESISALCRAAIFEYLDARRDELADIEAAFENADHDFRAAVKASQAKKPSHGAGKPAVSAAPVSSPGNSKRRRRVHA